MTPANSAFVWQSYNEQPAFSGEVGSWTANGLLEQLSQTWDKSDYLWYMTE